MIHLAVEIKQIHALKDSNRLCNDTIFGFQSESDPKQAAELSTLETYILEVIDPEPYDRYRLQILDRERDGEQVWQSDRLLRRGSVLSLSLPSALFEPGYYDLYLHGIDDKGQLTKLEESYLRHIRRIAAGR